MLNPENKVSIPEQTERPYIPKGSHPVENGRYLIATNEIERLFDSICQWVDNRSPGAIVYGRPRLGICKKLKV